MGITERDRSRVKALLALIKPRHSLAAKLDTLSDEQRDWYDGWKAYCDEWMSNVKRTCDDDNEREGRPYELHLRGGPFNRMRADIATALYGTTQQIPASVTDDQAQQLFMRECER